MANTLKNKRATTKSKPKTKRKSVTKKRATRKKPATKKVAVLLLRNAAPTSNLLVIGRTKDIYARKLRPSPAMHAAFLLEGIVQRGTDGNLWRVTANKNGVRAWRRV